MKSGISENYLQTAINPFDGFSDFERFNVEIGFQYGQVKREPECAARFPS
jgi:hypothetical protein